MNERVTLVINRETRVVMAIFADHDEALEDVRRLELATSDRYRVESWRVLQSDPDIADSSATREEIAVAERERILSALNLEAARQSCLLGEDPETHLVAVSRLRKAVYDMTRQEVVPDPA